MESVIEEVACFKYVSLYSNVLAFKIKYLNWWEWEDRRKGYWWVMKARKRHSVVKFNSKGVFIYDDTAVQHGSRTRDFHVHCWELGLISLETQCQAAICFITVCFHGNTGWLLSVVILLYFLWVVGDSLPYPPPWTFPMALLKCIILNTHFRVLTEQWF